MFKHLRTRYTTVLVYMTYKKHGYLKALCHLHKCRGTFSYLHKTAGYGLKLCQLHCLYRVDYHNIGLILTHALYYSIAVGTGTDIKPVACNSQPVGTELYLTFAFLTGYVQHGLILRKTAAYL